jgi:glycosyltransferase involved in cell wall biosynthesis
MRILNLIQCTNLAGMEQASLRLMQALQQLDHSCRLLSLNPIGDLGPLLEKSAIPAIGLKYRGPAGMLGLPTFRRALAEESPRTDSFLMTGHNLMAMLGLGGFCKGHRVLALHFHHQGVKPPWMWKAIYALAHQQFGAITYPCDFIRREAEDIYPAIKGKTHTIRLPIEVPPSPTSEDRATARESLGVPLDAPVVGNAGWLIPRKRWDVFLETAVLIKKMLPNAVFLIAGDGPLRTELGQLATQLGLVDSIRWMGWCPKMADFYHAIDLLLFNTDWDAFPVTPQEAMTYGRPVIASAINSGLKELFSEFTPGVLFAEHDIAALAQAAVDILINSERALCLGREGREGMRQLGEPARIAREYASLLGCS